MQSSDSARTENRRVGATARPVGRDAVACRRRGCPARKEGRAGQGGRQAATGRRVAKIAAGASAQRPGIADPRDAAAKSQPDARRGRLRETRRNGFRAAGPRWQAGARGAQARRGAPAHPCKRIHGARRTGCRAGSGAERRARSRGPDARAEVEAHGCARSRARPRRGPARRRFTTAAAPSQRAITSRAGWRPCRPTCSTRLAYRAALQKLARREGWSFRFYGIGQLEKLGAGAFLAVARANPHRGAGIVRLTYRPKRRAPRGQARARPGLRSSARASASTRAASTSSRIAACTRCTATCRAAPSRSARCSR